MLSGVSGTTVVDVHVLPKTDGAPPFPPFQDTAMVTKNANNIFGGKPQVYAERLAARINVRLPWRPSSLLTCPET